MAWVVEATGPVEEAEALVAELERQGEHATMTETERPGEYEVRVERDGWRCPYCWLLVSGSPAEHLRDAHGVRGGER